MATLTGTSTGLTFKGMTHLGISRGYDLQYSVADRTAKLYLCVGDEDNRVLISGTTPASRQDAVLDAIDETQCWSQKVNLWMVAEKNGRAVAKTTPVKFLTHVKPYYGRLTISQIATDYPKMTYPGNGNGRTLTKAINNRYYFRNGDKLETTPLNRGFDCTTFPMALLAIPSLPQPGYGKQLAEAAGAVPCDLEQMQSSDLHQKFADNTIPNGLYVLFSAGHVMLYHSDINWLFEFNYGGYRDTPAPDRELKAPQNLWWMRKLDERYRACFT
ncbi:MAG TPA: hypothetical protein VH539_13485 [Gemmatimonadaceae bacterium]|jgi:hypothetical protein